MLIDLLVRNWLTLHGLVVAFGLAFYVGVARALPSGATRRRRSPGSWRWPCCRTSRCRST